MTERLAQARDVLEPQLDAEGLEREEAVEHLRSRIPTAVPARHGDRRGARGAYGLGAHEPQRARDRGLHLAAVDDEVEHAVLDQELAALESLGQLLPDRLLDDARARRSR